uniref:Uncharacterized protein n=1 Tax=Anopheles culicifacies TaxID=139723 RepID=A0A182M4Y2_9DIPT
MLTSHCPRAYNLVYSASVSKEKLENKIASSRNGSGQKEAKKQSMKIAGLSRDSNGGSVAEESEARVFERTGPRFETHSGRSPVRRIDYPVAGTFKSRKPEISDQDLSML